MGESNIKSTIIRVQGMFCTNCEDRIRECLNSLPGIKNAQVSFEQEEAYVAYDPTLISEAQMKGAIHELGYETVENRSRYIKIVSILLIMIAVYLVADHLGWTSVFRMFPSIETSISLGMIFVTGLLTSIHCIAMCGGINLTQSTMAASGNGEVLKSNLAYNCGRVISYTVIGLIAGSIGSVLSFSNTVKGIISIVAGVLMILMTLNMLGVFKELRRFRPSGKLYQKTRSSYKGRSSFVIGLLNGLMPCGPLQAMQIYALSTGSIVLGGLSMLLFSLGTVPLMFLFGFVAGKLNRTYKKYMLIISAFLIFFMGLQMAGNGAALAGVNLKPASRSVTRTAMLEDGVQIVRSEVDYGSYEAIRVQAGIPVEWTIYVPEGKLNGCNKEIIVPDYDLDITLKEGETTLRFLPESAGTVPFTCWMGMISSVIEVE